MYAMGIHTKIDRIDDVFDDLVNIKGYSESEAYKAIYQGGLTIKST